MDQTYVVLRPSKTGEVKRDVLFRFGKYVLVFIIHVLLSPATNDHFYSFNVVSSYLPSFNVKQQRCWPSFVLPAPSTISLVPCWPLPCILFNALLIFIFFWFSCSLSLYFFIFFIKKKYCCTEVWNTHIRTYYMMCTYIFDEINTLCVWYFTYFYWRIHIFSPHRSFFSI